MFQNICVIGGKGFIGSNLVKYLKLFVSSDFKIINYFFNFEDIHKYNFSENTIFVDCVGVKSFYSYQQIDFATKNYQLIDKVKTYKLILTRLQNRYIYISSGGSLYSRDLHGYWSEADEVKPISFYGKANHQIEKIVLENNGIVLRGSNIYGEEKINKFSQGVITVLLNNYINNITSKIYNRHAVRDYLYIDDFVKLLSKVILNPKFGEVFNLGSGQGNSTINIIDIINSYLNLSRKKSLSIDYSNETINLKDVCVLDMKKFISIYGEIEPLNLDQGIFKMILQRNLL